jgi:3-oxoacyl-(acyl-carrier-protein) synthase
MMQRDREAWITGIGLVSSLGEGCDATWPGLMAGRPKIDEASFAPYPVHRLAAVDFAKQIPKSEQRLGIMLRLSPEGAARRRTAPKAGFDLH